MKIHLDGMGSNSDQLHTQMDLDRNKSCVYSICYQNFWPDLEECGLGLTGALELC
jgi:hypothetical protein